MILPRIIEYILSLERPGGKGRLAYQGASQLVIPIFPPNTTINLSSGPYRGDFANIIFLWALGGSLVPNTFYAWAQQWGSRMYDGIVTTCLIDNDFGFYAVVTEAEPTTLQITNRSALCQQFESYMYFLCVSTKQDLDLIMEALASLANIEGPRPPIEGGS